MLRKAKAALTGLLTLVPAATALAQGAQTDCTTCPAPPCNWIIVVQGEPTPFIIAFVVTFVIAFAIGYAVARGKGPSDSGR